MNGLFFLLCTGSISLFGRSQPINEQIAFLEEMRIALLDVKQAVSSQKLDISLLEEKLNKLEKPSIHASLEQRISTLEKHQEQFISDLKHLTQHAKELTTTIAQLSQQLHAFDAHLHKESERFNEVSRLRSTIHSLTKAIESGNKTHLVRAGDTLEKIARLYQISIEELKKSNGLTYNKILIGQELKIPK